MKKFFLSIYTLHMLIWAVFFWLNYSYLVNWLPQIGMYATSAAILTYVALLFTGIYFTAVYVNHFLLLPRFFLRKQYVAYFLWVGVLLVVVSVLKVELDAYFLVPVMPWLRTAGHYISTLPYLLFTMGLSSWQVMAEAHRKEKLRADLLQKTQTEAELKWLKAQINPHFLFNALNNIYTLAYLKSDEAAPMLLRLSEIMRYVMNDTNRQTVPIEEEIRYIEQYIALNGLKQVNKEKTTLKISNQSSGVMIEPMLLINFIENAYKHSNLDHKDGWINIRLTVSNTDIHFNCRNTFDTNAVKDRAAGIGLRNVQQRLALRYPAYRLHIHIEDTRIFTIDLLIPLSYI
jgi:two-component system, LytTR family, sensor kinase